MDQAFSKNMELEQVHLDLLDLRQLYCLMQSCFSPQQNARVEILGGRARLLFKSLLDDATAKVFMAYSKIVETPNVSDELCVSQPEKTENGVPKPKLIFEAPPRILSMHTQNKSTPSMASNSGLSTTPEKRKQCRACARRGTMKRNTSVENNRDVSDKQDGLTHFLGDDEQSKQTRGSTENKNETEKKSRTTVNERSSSLNSFVSCPSTSHETTGYDLHRQIEKKKQDAAIDYSEDIFNTIKKIESHILALKLRSRSRNHIPESGLGRLSGAAESSPPFRSNLLNNPVGQLSKNKTSTKSTPNQELSLRNDFGRSVSAGRASRLHGCEQEVKRKATVGGIESLSQSANQAGPPEFVHGFVVPSVPEDTGTKDLTRKTVRSNPSHYGSASGRSRAKEEEPTKNMPRQMVISPTLLDHPTTELMVLPTPIKNRTDRATKRIIPMARVVSREKMNLPREEETERSQSSSSASSSPSWASTASSSPSWASTASSSLRSSDSSDYSSPRQYVGPVDLHRVKVSPIKRQHKPDSHKGSEKMIGGLRRLKNKLGLILHHHHHHHHHHHNGDDNQLTRMDRRHSMWKHLGNLFHNPHKNRPVKKYNKSRVKKAANQDQVGHFHALAEGFARHVWKRGRSKTSKGKIRGLKRQKKKKKTGKKLKWWKLPNRAKGFGNKKRRLKFA